MFYVYCYNTCVCILPMFIFSCFPFLMLIIYSVFFIQQRSERNCISIRRIEKSVGQSCYFLFLCLSRSCCFLFVLFCKLNFSNVTWSVVVASVVICSSKLCRVELHRTKQAIEYNLKNSKEAFVNKELKGPIWLFRCPICLHDCERDWAVNSK